MTQLVKNPPAMWETWVQSLGWEDPLEKGKALLLQYSGLENFMDYTDHGVAKSWTRLSNIHFHFHDLNDRRDRKERRQLLFIRTEYYITGATSDLE